jgi:hypothetical protein
MPRAFRLFVLGASMSLLAGIASAQAVPAAAPPAATALPSPAVASQGAPIVDLSQLFAAPSTDGLSTTPAPRWSSCTMFECRHACSAPGCVPVCINLQTCECEAICK